MDEQLIERAVEAAAKVLYADLLLDAPVNAPLDMADAPTVARELRGLAAKVVTVALAVVEASIKAQALREAAAWWEPQGFASTQWLMERAGDIEAGDDRGC